MAKPELGAKRQCQSCGIKFFDLNKNPILCPKCGTVFHVAPLARAPSRGGAEADEEAEVDKEAAETISLDEVAENENKVEAVDVDEDVEIEAADDDTFLEEEEEEDDDVTGLIDGDIETDEET